MGTPAPDPRLVDASQPRGGPWRQALRRLGAIVSRDRAPTLLIGAAALAFSLTLLAHTQEGVFYSGDAGLKFLMAAQLARGDLHPDLRLQAPAWIRDLWDLGLYPFEAAAVRVLHGRRFIQYPLVFPAVSAPAYAIGGFRALYVLPTLGAWATLWLVGVACRGMGMGRFWSAAAVASLAFASPFLLYGAMFWEHTLGVALSVLGFALALRSATDRSRALLAGMSLGVAAWFRPELAVLAAMAVALAWLRPRLGEDRSHRVRLTVGATVSLGAFALANVALFGTPLGLHGTAISQGFDLAGSLEGAAVVLGRLSHLLVQHFPLAVPLAVVGIVSWVRRARGTDARAHLWLLAAAAFYVLVPLVLHGPERAGHGGKQWGPRFLLVAMALACVGGFALVEAAWRSATARARGALAVVLAIAFSLGCAANAIAGFEDLRDDYAHRVLPALENIRSRDTRFIAVSDHFVSQELAALMEDHWFALARSGEELDAVARAALGAGIGHFLFVSDASITLDGIRPVPTPAGPGQARLSLRGIYGSYAIHDVQVFHAAP